MILPEISLNLSPTNPLLSQGVRHKVEGYLAHKWGLAGSLPSTHTYKNTKPAFGGAQNLTFQPISDKQAGQSADLSVTSDSGLSTFTYDSNDSSVVSFSYDANANSYKVNALKVGKVTITATQPGQSPWLSATATQPFHCHRHPTGGSDDHLCGHPK